MQPGRPSKLTPETQEKIVNAIRLSATYELASSYAGISYATFNNWMKRGSEAKSGEFFEFFNAVKTAEGEGAISSLIKIEQAAKDGAWQAAAWKLERRYPASYGRTVQQVEHSGPDGGSIPIQYVDYRSGINDSSTTES